MSPRFARRLISTLRPASPGFACQHAALALLGALSARSGWRPSLVSTPPSLRSAVCQQSGVTAGFVLLIRGPNSCFWGRQEAWDLSPVVETVNVAPGGDEVAVPWVYLGRRPETGVRGSFYGVWPVVYEAESSE